GAGIFARENVKEPRRPSTFSAASSVEERKKIQAKQTKFTVKKIRAMRGQPPSLLRFPVKLCQARVTASAAPCSSPQIIKFQLAPCHKPASSMVRTRLA